MSVRVIRMRRKPEVIEAYRVSQSTPREELPDGVRFEDDSLFVGSGTGFAAKRSPTWYIPFRREDGSFGAMEQSDLLKEFDVIDEPADPSSVVVGRFAVPMVSDGRYDLAHDDVAITIARFLTLAAPRPRVLLVVPRQFEAAASD